MALRSASTLVAATGPLALVEAVAAEDVLGSIDPFGCSMTRISDVGFRLTRICQDGILYILFY